MVVKVVLIVGYFFVCLAGVCVCDGGNSKEGFEVGLLLLCEVLFLFVLLIFFLFFTLS